MAVTNQELFNIFLANPNMSDTQIVSLMETRGISPEQMSSTFGIPVSQVVSRMAPVLAENVAQYGTQTQTLANNETGQTEVSQRTLAGGFNAYQDESGQLSFSRVSPDKPGMIQLYGPNGEYRGEEKITTTTQDLIKNLGPIALAAGGTALAQGLMGGTLLGGAPVGTGLEFAGSGGAFDLANAGIAGGTATFTPAQLALIEAGATAAEVAAAGASGGLLSSAIPPTVPPTVPTTTPPVVPPTVTPPVVPPTGVPPVVPPTGVPPIVPPTGVPPIVTSAVSSLIPTAVKGLLTPDVISGVTGTAGSLLQSQTSKAAAEKAAADINAATQAGVTASQFRPVGMTTRFGTSNYTYDPKTGQMVSAGYQLSPEAKNAQDRLVKLAESGLQQAEGAQQQFAPLQTGAQGLFNLGNQYIAQSPQDVAQKYLNQQMALLQPGREVELANLQNRLQQQGRAGLSVAQGGTMGATTPELQALYNARAQQEAQLAANAQQYGQQNVLFGAGLLGQGATAMGNYYGGQQQAYSPYTTALGQVQGLETAAQQPLMLGAQLGQQSATAGANAGRLGVLGSQAAGNILTGNAATYNPYAGLLTAAGSPTSMFGQAAAQWLTGGVPAQTAMSAPATSYGAGNYYGNQDVLGTWGV